MGKEARIKAMRSEMGEPPQAKVIPLLPQVVAMPPWRLVKVADIWGQLGAIINHHVCSFVYVSVPVKWDELDENGQPVEGSLPRPTNEGEEPNGRVSATQISTVDGGTLLLPGEPPVWFEKLFGLAELQQSRIARPPSGLVIP